MNRMYSPSAYFLSRVFSSLIVGLIDPTIVTFFLYFGVGIELSATTFFEFYLSAILMSCCGFAIGFVGGVSFDAPDSAKNVSQFLNQIFSAFSGALANASTLPVWIGWLQYISP